MRKTRACEASPSIGSGAIYAVPESEIAIKPIELQPWWRRCYAMDVGWNRTAVVWAAHDYEDDVVYLYSEHYSQHAEPAVPAQGIEARGEWIHGVIDPAARGRSQHDGQQPLAIYKQLGLELTVADNSVEAGIYTVWERMSSGRLKVFDTLQNWLAEFRIYRRDEKGRIVKERDHLQDCTPRPNAGKDPPRDPTPRLLERGHGFSASVAGYRGIPRRANGR
jgi:hypothetical protein